MTKLEAMINSLRAAGKLLIEYDDGGPPKRSENKHSAAIRRGRERGFYFGENRLPIGYMKVSDMEPLSKLFEDLYIASQD